MSFTVRILTKDLPSLENVGGDALVVGNLLEIIDVWKIILSRRDGSLLHVHDPNTMYIVPTKTIMHIDVFWTKEA